MWFRRGAPLVALMPLGWALLAVVLGALTTWWVVFALIPPAMMVTGMAMMGAMARAAGDSSAWPGGWCALGAWFAPAEGDGRQREQGRGGE